MGKYHVKTAAEVQYNLEVAVRYSEEHMENGFHQVPLSIDPAKNFSIFQRHKGLNRMKKLYLGNKDLNGTNTLGSSEGRHNQQQAPHKGHHSTAPTSSPRGPT